jgi:hypothetical protein
MRTYVYLSMTPESLVASQLPPEEFGAYMAVGTRKSAHGQVIFCDLREGYQSIEFDQKYLAEHCIPHADGQPKHSLYLGIYRVLERVPLAAINSLWLTSAHGQTLELKPAEQLPEVDDRYYLYQELCPVHPLIASKLTPHEFASFITRPDKPLFVPRICFLDFDLGEMAKDPENGKPNHLYYPDPFWHLRGCLLELLADKRKHTKTVDRLHLQSFPYHCIKNGFYLGDPSGVRFFPFPTRTELEGKHYSWWRSTR